jgi:pimeloyl-ACP methyl ester carboxylesterase
LNDGFALIAWAHGNSGPFANCAPSHYQDLLYEYQAPFALALSGYVVVAPDYAGHGISSTSQNQTIYTSLIGGPSLANDLVYAVKAAQTAFTSLSKSFVVMGHSQGGLTAWAVAERQVTQPVPGYLGAVVGSPITDAILQAQEADGLLDTSGLTLVPGLLSTFGSAFRLSEILTPAGIKIWEFMEGIQGCNAVIDAFLLTMTGLVKANWTENYWIQSYNNLSKTGKGEIVGPMLILQGTADLSVPPALTTAAVNYTCAQWPESQIEYVMWENVTHVPVLAASQRRWLQWIDDRFEGVAVGGRCMWETVASVRNYSFYQEEINWYMEWSTEEYEVA